MISVITPTNNTRWLEDAYKSLIFQGVEDWEWVLVMNGDAISQPWKPQGKKDTRIKTYASDIKTVGGLKRFASKLARGDIIVELDHDDMLTPDCLEKLLDAFGDPKIGFAYSNHAIFWDCTFEPYEFGAFWGWEYRDYECYGERFREARGFPPTPHSLAYIYYCPNHVRAWRKDAYWEAGGHDPDMLIIDDQDLVSRTYLVTEFAFIDECLYLQRYHPRQGYRLHNQDIQKQTRQVRDKYLPQIVKRWCELEGLASIDICCGDAKPEGYVGIDLISGDVIADLDNDWPLADDSVGCVRAYDGLEHLKDKTHTMNEIWRVLAPHGVLMSLTPSTDGRGAFQDPTHVSYWNENTFWYFTDPKYMKYDPRINCRFQDMRHGYAYGDQATLFPSDFQRQHDIAYTKMDLVAVKENMGRYPGAHFWRHYG